MAFMGRSGESFRPLAHVTVPPRPPPSLHTHARVHSHRTTGHSPFPPLPPHLAERTVGHPNALTHSAPPWNPRSKTRSKTPTRPHPRFLPSRHCRTRSMPSFLALLEAKECGGIGQTERNDGCALRLSVVSRTANHLHGGTHLWLCVRWDPTLPLEALVSMVRRQRGLVKVEVCLHRAAIPVLAHLIVRGCLRHVQELEVGLVRAAGCRHRLRAEI